MKIAFGNSRMDKRWKNKSISWEALCEIVSRTKRTTETVEEYRKMKKGQQDNIKDVDGFVGGHLREGRRKNGNVLCRSMLTLDMDYAAPDVWDNIKMLYDFKCCVYTHTPKKIRDSDCLFLFPAIFPKRNTRRLREWSQRKSESICLMILHTNPAALCIFLQHQ